MFKICSQKNDEKLIKKIIKNIFAKNWYGFSILVPKKYEVESFIQ